jgi:hypothetical protein
MQEPSLASGLGPAAADVAAACIGSPSRHLSMSPRHAAHSSSHGCHSPSVPTTQELHTAHGMLSSGSAAVSPVRLQAQQLPAGLLPAHLLATAGGVGNSSSQEDAEAAAYEARLVAKVLEMERNMQALESQLMHVGGGDLE